MPHHYTNHEEWMNEAPDLPGGRGAYSTGGRGSVLPQRQTGLVYDLLSEGPIEGLVNEAEGVFLNGVPLRDHDTNLAFREITTTGTISSGSLSTLTVPANVITELDSDTITERTVVILGAGSGAGGTAPTDFSPEATFSIEANSTRLTSDGLGFFNRAMAGFDSGSPDLQLGWEEQTFLEIPGAGPNGASLFANIVGFEGSGVVNLDTKAIVEVSSGTGIKIAHKTKISSVNTANNTITLATAATHAVTNESVIINPPITRNLDSTQSRWNFANVAYAFRTGTENQRPIEFTGDIASNASYLHGVNLPLKQNTKFAGGSASDSNIIIKNLTVNTGDTYEFSAEKFLLNSGESIIASGTNGSLLTATITYTEIS